MNWHAYHLPPIDFGWQHLKSVTETLMLLRMQSSPDAPNSFDDFERDWVAAQEVARTKGWEGDFRGDPVVFWLPDELEFRYGFAFKQYNNGSTFVVSPQPLPWAAALEN